MGLSVKQLFKQLSAEKFDVKNVNVYARDGKGGCWHVEDLALEDSGAYFTLGAETNPQNTVESEVDIMHPEGEGK